MQSLVVCVVLEKKLKELLKCYTEIRAAAVVDEESSDVSDPDAMCD